MNRRKKQCSKKVYTGDKKKGTLFSRLCQIDASTGQNGLCNFHWQRKRGKRDTNTDSYRLTKKTPKWNKYSGLKHNKKTYFQKIGVPHYASIPTEYEGIMFRSRLEAKWAVFFDLCGLDWEYEPIDLDGWIPDFRVNGILVEIKPYTKLEEFEENGVIAKINRVIQEPVLLLGSRHNVLYMTDRSTAFIIHTNTGYAISPLFGDIVADRNYSSQVEEFWKKATNTVQWKPR